jgi:alpha-L-rhamnosidase
MPFTSYEATLCVTDGKGEMLTQTLIFETGRMGTPFLGAWITDGAYRFTEKKTSPTPMLFRRNFSCEKKIKSARLYATALGIYEVCLNGEKVGDRYFAPGFTSYKHNLAYQTYDVTNALQKDNRLDITVAGGWAVGAFVMTRKNRITAPRQALLAELRIEYEDGAIEILSTDESFLVTRDSAVRFAEFYDGEIYDATVQEKDMRFVAATKERVKISPEYFADYGAPVKVQEVFNVCIA